jgi:hypothetical protein
LGRRYRLADNLNRRYDSEVGCGLSEEHTPDDDNP